ARHAGPDARVVTEHDLGRPPPVQVRRPEPEARVLDRVGPERRLVHRPWLQLLHAPLATARHVPLLLLHALPTARCTSLAITLPQPLPAPSWALMSSTT